MRKFECKCSSRNFNANPTTNMIQCTNCRQRYIWNNTWEKFDVIKNFKKQTSKFIKEQVKQVREFFEDPVEFAKKHYVKKERKLQNKRIMFKNCRKTAEYEKILQKNKILGRWKNVIEILNERGYIVFYKNDHHGSVRGKQIAITAHRDLNRIGIKTRLKLRKGRKAKLELIK